MNLAKTAKTVFKNRPKGVVLKNNRQPVRSNPKEGPTLDYSFNSMQAQQPQKTWVKGQGIVSPKLGAKKKDMPDFLDQNRPAKVKEIYRALKRDHPDMPAEMKARIAARQGKPGKQKQGPPYKGPIKSKHASYMEETFKKIAMVKQAAFQSELWGTLANPLNWAVGYPASFLGAGIPKQYTPEELKDIKEDMWKNLLIPGVGPWRLGRRAHTALDPEK